MGRRIWILGAILLMGLSPALSQSRYFTKTGKITFFSQAPLEDIEAVTQQVVSFVDVSTGDMVFTVHIKSFQFKKSLMQEHFNENYVESDKYPKATFKGKVQNMQQLKMGENKLHKVLIEGELTIHGVARTIKTEGTMEVKNGQVLGKSTFSVTPQEYKIEIPFLVKEHIAKRIDITVNVVYVPYVEKSL